MTIQQTDQHTDKVLRLLGDVRRTKTDLDLIEHRLLVTLGVQKSKPVSERAVEWLFAALVEKPVSQLVKAVLDRFDDWRSRRNP